MRVFGQHAVAAAVLLGETPNLAEGRGRLRGLHTRGTRKSAAAAHQKKMKKTLMTIHWGDESSRGCSECKVG